MRVVWVLVLAIVASVCVGAESVRFEDVTETSGISFVHDPGVRGNWHYVEMMGGGCALFDFDGDGFLDLFLINGLGPHALYRNAGIIGEIRFVDVTEKAGVAGIEGVYGMGCTVGDYTNDGNLDLYVTGFDRNVLYRNEGNGRFTDVTEEAGVIGGGWSAGATFVDIDNNGHLDLYVARYLEYDLETEPVCDRLGVRTYCDPGFFKGAPDLLFRNNGDGAFSDISIEAGIHDPTGKGLGVLTLDFDGDGKTDLYVANDTTPNFLYRNTGGKFEEIGLLSGVAFNEAGAPQAGMGIDAGDCTGNGLQDIFVTNFSYETNAFYANEGDGFFSFASAEAGISGPSLLPLAFGISMFDYDNDGNLDVYVANGHIFSNVKAFSEVEEFAQPDQLFRNENGRFRDVSEASGIHFVAVGRGTATGDLDGNGYLDLIVVNLGESPRIFRNTGGSGNNWFMVRLAGGPGSNRFGIGAQVKIRAGDRTQIREVRSQSSYLSVSDFQLHFGLGTAERVDELSVRWPSGQVQVLSELNVNQVVTVAEGKP